MSPTLGMGQEPLPQETLQKQDVKPTRKSERSSESLIKRGAKHFLRGGLVRPYPLQGTGNLLQELLTESTMN